MLYLQSALELRLEKIRQRKIKKLQKEGKEIPEVLSAPIKLPQVCYKL